MKNNLLILFCVALSHLYSQTWCYTGAEWTYGYHFTFPTSNGYIKLNYTKDTLINSNLYNKLNEVFYGYNAAYGTNSVTLNQGVYFIRKNGSIVSLYNGQQPEDTLFNFNATIGDTWLRTKHSSSVVCNAIRRPVTVLDTGSNIINGIRLKRIVLSYIRGFAIGYPTTTYIDTVYDRIGSVKNHLVPWVCETSIVMPDASGSGPIGNFRCYTDNSFVTYHQPNTPACYYINSVNEIKGLQNIKMFPNPVTNLLQIRFDETTNKFSIIEIHNNLGELVFKSQLKSEINTEAFNPGIYTLRVISSEQINYYFKFVKE